MRARNFELEPTLTETDAVVGSWWPRVDGKTLTYQLRGEILSLPDLALMRTADHVRLEVEYSGGGDLRAAMRLLEVLAERGASSHVVGCAESSAALVSILAPGQRTIARTARLVLHRPTLVLYGDSSALHEHAAWLDQITADLAGALSIRCNQPPETVESWLTPGVDVAFDAEGAVEAGLADAIA
jgi:ATP-dependent protease ClpP protease subunit